MKKLSAMFAFTALASGFLAARAFAQETPAPSPSTAAPADALRPRMKMPEPADPKLPSLFLAGDSTVRNGADDGQGKGAEGQWGWGHTIADLFDPVKINVVNRAVGGLSSRTYLTGGHWERVMAMLKPGDFVIIQLGTNDDGALNDEPPGPLRARGTIHGIGEETKEIDNVLTKKHEVVHTYGWYLRKFIDDTKSKNAMPILCSIVPRKSWDDGGRAKRNTNYEGWAAEVAAQEKIGFIDLNEIIARHYDELGRAAVMKLYPQVTPDEHTHTNLAGLKALKGDPFAPFFSAVAKDIAPVDLGKPAPMAAK